MYAWFPVNQTPFRSHKSPGVDDRWSPDMSGSSVPRSVFPAFRAWWDQAEAGCLVRREGREGPTSEVQAWRGQQGSGSLWGKTVDL